MFPANIKIMTENSIILHRALSLLENTHPVISDEFNRDIKKKKGWRTRFAPSPSGFLHIGHAYAALIVWQIAGENPDNFLLRIEDLDYTRCSTKYIKQIKLDLKWLDIAWNECELYQSQRFSQYKSALNHLTDLGLIYPCYLSRSEISEFLSPPVDGILKQPNTRERLSDEDKKRRKEKGITPVLRLDMKRAIQRTGSLSWSSLDGTVKKAEPEKFGDIIIGRRDVNASYHLSVVIDDAESKIEVVTRGEDLRASTDIHCLLQNLLQLPSPYYFHHPVIFGSDGKKLSKRHQSPSLSSFRRNKRLFNKILKKTIVGNISAFT